MIHFRTKKAQEEFSYLYPFSTLPDMLNKFSDPCSLHRIVPSPADVLWEPFLWLLKRGYLSQLHEYIYLLPSLSNDGEERLGKFAADLSSETELFDHITQGKPTRLAELFGRWFSSLSLSLPPSLSFYRTPINPFPSIIYSQTLSIFQWRISQRRNRVERRDHQKRSRYSSWQVWSWDLDLLAWRSPSLRKYVGLVDPFFLFFLIFLFFCFCGFMVVALYFVLYCERWNRQETSFLFSFFFFFPLITATFQVKIFTGHFWIKLG